MKTTTEECYSLDVCRLCREGLLTPGWGFSWSWSRLGQKTASIGGLVEGGDRAGRVVLLFRNRSGPGVEWEDVRQSVTLEWTPCSFGGQRPWFACPRAGCGRRVAVLYGLGKWFLCRHCYDLSYESQREDKTLRALRRALKIRQRLGGSANMMEHFPEKPKGMHHETYMRLFGKHHEAEMEQLIGIREWLDKLQQQLS
jgi:hypothetical protein